MGYNNSIGDANLVAEFFDVDIDLIMNKSEISQRGILT